MLILYLFLFWFGLVSIYPDPLPAEYLSSSSSCLYCYVWGGLSVFWQFVVPLYCGGSSLWVGLDDLACQGFLVREACVLVDGADFFCLECNEVSSSEF